jgi:ABC-type nickel/cobalt efflux system permease component RcnA
MLELQVLFWIKVAAAIIGAIGFWFSWRNLTRIRATAAETQAEAEDARSSPKHSPGQNAQWLHHSVKQPRKVLQPQEDHNSCRLPNGSLPK